MGPLRLPPAGLVYVDANMLIYSVERIEPYRSLLETDVGAGSGRQPHRRK